MTPHGPIELSCTTVSPSVHAKCFISAGMLAYDPAGNFLPADESNFSPIPRWNVPERTVIRSGQGCVCGGIL